MRSAIGEDETEKALLIEYPCSSWKDERSLDLMVGESRDCQWLMFLHSAFVGKVHAKPSDVATLILRCR